MRYPTVGTDKPGEAEGIPRDGLPTTLARSRLMGSDRESLPDDGKTEVILLTLCEAKTPRLRFN
jgi:hypothetical protein